MFIRAAATDLVLAGFGAPVSRRPSDGVRARRHRFDPAHHNLIAVPLEDSP